jgi:hypothetical protein
MCTTNNKSRATADGSFKWLGLCVALLVLFVWNSLYYSPWTVDDAYISLRYAQNLLDGQGLVYNPGERVEGFSNFSWVILAASIMRLGLPIVTSLKFVGLLCGVTTILMAALLVRRLVGTADRTLACTLTAPAWRCGVNLDSRRLSLRSWSSRCVFASSTNKNPSVRCRGPPCFSGWRG